MRKLAIFRSRIMEIIWQIAEIVWKESCFIVCLRWSIHTSIKMWKQVWCTSTDCEKNVWINEYIYIHILFLQPQNIINVVDISTHWSRLNTYLWLNMFRITQFLCHFICFFLTLFRLLKYYIWRPRFWMGDRRGSSGVCQIS